jgi:ABC-2 type transport system permease protein
VSGAIAIARRDLLGAFTTPLAWVLMSATGLLAAVVFLSVTFRDGEIANLRPVLVALGWATLLLAPAVAMRSIAEERRQGTLEILRSAPIGVGSIVMGKFIAAVVVLAAMLLPIAVLAVPLELFGRPDPGEILCGVLGLLLVGASIAAVGILASSMGTSQVLAYLGAMFPWLAAVVAVKLLPTWLGGAWPDRLEALDPLRRLDDFVIGLFDSADLVYFLVLIAIFLLLATISLGRDERRSPTGLGRLGRLAHLTLRVGGVLACGVAIVAIASVPALRVRLDLTRTRAYSLAPETRELLADLEGPWSIDLLVVEEQGDRALLEQVDEVLRRFAEANPAIEVGRIDPTRPEDLGAYEALLERLAAGFEEESRNATEAIEEAMVAFDELVAFAIEESPRAKGRLAAARARADADAASLEVLAATSAMLEQVATTGPRLEQEIRRLLETSSARPFPDLESARSALAAHHRARSDQLAAGLPRDPRASRIARSLRGSMDRLERLPRSKLGEIATAIAGGEAAVVSGPDGAVVVPGWQILPRSTFADAETVRFDRRFRGEQLLVAAVRSLDMPAPPVAILMHTEPRSMLRRQDTGGEAAAIADELRAARFEVREWRPSDGALPVAEQDGPTVFVPIPPLTRRSIEPDEAESALLDATRELIDGGRPVLLSVGPSVLPLLGGQDPWAELAAGLGVDADTARTLLELPPGEEAREPQATHLAAEGETTHPLGAVLDDQALLLFYPVPISLDADGPATAVLGLAPSETRWVEEDWRRLRDIDRVPEAKRDDDARPVVAAIERPRPDGGVQRALVVAANGWLLSNLADRTVPLGGERVAFANPGNRELARSGIAWLAGLDEWVGGGGPGREVARLAGIAPADRAAWTAGLLVGLPVLPLLVGGVIWRRRERAR